MTQVLASSARKRVGLGPSVPEAWQPMVPAPVSTLSERRRAGNRTNLGRITELSCECATPSCRKTFPAGAVSHRGTANRFIVAPAHLNGETAVRVADRFIVIEPRRLVDMTERRPGD
jgi:hypothetical protein